MFACFVCVLPVVRFRFGLLCFCWMICWVNIFGDYFVCAFCVLVVFWLCFGCVLVVFGCVSLCSRCAPAVVVWWWCFVLIFIVFGCV